MKMKPPSGPKKQTQTKPISSKAKIAYQKIQPQPFVRRSEFF